MLMLLQAVAWYVVVGIGAFAASPLLRQAGVKVGPAWAAGRIVAWAAAGYVAWLAGLAGFGGWWWVGVPVVAAGAIMAARRPREFRWREVAIVEGVGATAFLVVALLRLPMLAISGTEKPMDLAILATLLRPDSLPPQDPWLAGVTLPYYYWGFVPWTLPARLLGLAPDVAYNLMVPLLAALVAQGTWALARELGAAHRDALVAAFLAVLAGTPDGWRQVLHGAGIGGQDLWASSRQITGAITEFPLFTFHLGDLHPHLLAVPLVLAALLVARLAAEHGGAGRWLGTSLLFGATAATNPWYLLPTGLAVTLLAVAPADRFRWPWRRDLTRWGVAVAVGIGGWLLFAPFWLGYHAPFSGFGLVTTPTRWDQLALFLGGMLIVPLLIGWEMAGRWGGLRRDGRQLMRAFWLATLVVVGAITGSVALGIVVAMTGFLAAQIVRFGRRPLRPMWALAVVPMALVGGMELVYVVDPYGGDLYRMNTVFKSSYLAFTLLAAVVPVLLAWLRKRRPRPATLGLVLVLLAGLPQLVSVASRVRPPVQTKWNGLGQMVAGEEEAARWLSRRPPGTVLIEGVGDAYSDAARLSAASGVPTVLGWENHERVWRGGGIDDELNRRREAIARLYTCGDPAEVRSVARSLGASLIAVGSVERRVYGEEGLAAVMSAGETAFAGGACTLVRIDE